MVLAFPELLLDGQLRPPSIFSMLIMVDHFLLSAKSTENKCEGT